MFEQQAQILREEASGAIARQQNADAWAQSSQGVYEEVLGQLNTANRFTSDVNAAYATLVRDFFTATAGRLGITPDQLYARYPLRIVAESPVDGVQYDQGGRLGTDSEPNILHQAAKADEQIGRWAAGEHLGGKIVEIGKPSALLRSFGMDELPIHLTTSVLDKARDKHAVNPNDLRGFALALQNPIAVFASKRGDGHLVVVTEIQHTDGNILAAIDLNKSREFLEVHDIRSIHPKQDQNVQKWIDEGLLLGYEKTKGREWLDRISGSNSPRASNPAALAKARIYEFGGEYNQEANYKDLIAQHNLSAENLLHAKKMGGIPVPSLAVTKKAHPLTGFGEITLLAAPDMIDPKGYAGTKVFGADIYSPRYPKAKKRSVPPRPRVTCRSRTRSARRSITSSRMAFPSSNNPGGS